MRSRACRRVSSGLMVVVLCTGVACGENPERATTSTSTITDATTTSAPPTTVSTTTTLTTVITTTATVAPTTVATTAVPTPAVKSDCPAEGTVPPFERAARCLYDAWRHDDRGAAAKFAEPEAVAGLFEISKAEWEFQGCSEGYDDSYLGWGCAYVARNISDGFEVGIGFTFVAYDDEIVVKLVEIAGE